MEGKHMFLHGKLEATIYHATPHASTRPFDCLAILGKLTYVTIKINQTTVAKTSHENDRTWNQTFQILCAHRPDSTVTITMKTNHSILGKIVIRAHQLLTESGPIDGHFSLDDKDGKPNRPELKLRLKLLYRPANREPGWSQVLENGDFKGLKNVSFPLRSNCSVTLYQDAHHHDNFRPPSDLCGTPKKLWEDVYKAIEGAKQLVYIAGWSFNPNLVLVRDEETKIPHARGVMIGELLKRKAEEGIAVRIMLWNDETSLPLIKNKGLMNTGDEDAFAYFEHTKVVCKLSPRLHNDWPTFFAHHQKTLTLDTIAPNPSNEREITSFIGGLDLCDGRYDTDEHSLFKTLNTEAHSKDFYQTNIAGAMLQKGGPRTPWHDVHAQVTGEAARDILTNFEQRWKKQCDPSLVINTDKITSLAPPKSPKRDWQVQVFRSIDHTSMTHSTSKTFVERSIQDAYIEAIRRAERFIYIENQYFIGGCDFWEHDTHSGCKNLIPIEIALKVANKIKAKERFGVYVVMPMWPEGVPESESVQDILHWTRETMGMMYKLIGDAIKETGCGGSGEAVNPRDYLNFYCLGNREEKGMGELVASQHPHAQTQYWKAQMHRRFMIYVHSKVMIVDDRYILMGSANVNQRSMDGSRDTEIAIGCYESKNEELGTAQGDIHAYRMSLWYEHTRQAHESFLNPHSLECVRSMRSIGDQMWDIYSGENLVDMNGVHLISYPMSVTNDGLVKDLGEGDMESFPDTKARVRGTRSPRLPAILTT